MAVYIIYVIICFCVYVVTIIICVGVRIINYVNIIIKIVMAAIC
jgi:hypothetical protein